MFKISLDALLVLDAIDRGGSFSAAGNELHRVPSTISYTVSKLEQDLGVQIFERQGPKITLTIAGEELIREGRYLLKAAEDLERRVRRVAAGWETEFTIGLDSLYFTAALESDIVEFYKIADKTRLRIVSESLMGTWEALLDRRVDLLIAAPGEGPPGGGYIAESMGSVSFVFVVAPTHPLAKMNTVLTKADLHPYRAISVADSVRHMPPRSVGLLFGQDTLTVPDMRSKYALQLAGVGFGFLPEPCARAAIASGALVVKQVDEARLDESFSLAWRVGEEGAALDWWRKHMRKAGSLTRLLTHITDKNL